jgi:sulfide:quinone oxidoreductase
MPERPRVLIAGGGVAALEAALALEEVAADALDLSLLAPSPRFEYRPLSVAEPFGLGRAHLFDLPDLLGDREVEMVADALESVEAERREVHTTGGRSLRYDALLIAIGATRRDALAGAITFSGSKATDDVRRVLQDAEAGRVQRLAVAIPPGVVWELPAYELALMASAHLDEREVATEVALVTPEKRPVSAFGRRAGEAVEEMLRLRRIEFHSAVPVRAEAGELIVQDGDPIPADAVLALPQIVAPKLEGLPGGELGFVPVDAHCRVVGRPGVYAAGDITDFPLKQGGLAAQQADAAAEAIAADLERGPDPQPFEPVLRGLLLAGRAPRYLRAEILRSPATQSSAQMDATGWPPAKIAGRRLGPLLALHGAPGWPPPDAIALQLEGPDANRLAGRAQQV